MTIREEAYRHTIEAAKRKISALEAECNKWMVLYAEQQELTEKYRVDGEVGWQAYEAMRQLVKEKIDARTECVDAVGTDSCRAVVSVEVGGGQ